MSANYHHYYNFQARQALQPKPHLLPERAPSSRTTVENKVWRPTISSYSVPLPVYSSSSSGASAWGGGPAALGGSSSGTESSSIRERDWWELNVRYGCSAVPYKMRLHSFSFPERHQHHSYSPKLWMCLQAAEPVQKPPLVTHESIRYGLASTPTVGSWLVLHCPLAYWPCVMAVPDVVNWTIPGII